MAHIELEPKPLRGKPSWVDLDSLKYENGTLKLCKSKEEPTQKEIANAVEWFRKEMLGW